MKTNFLKPALLATVILSALSFTSLETIKKKIDIKESTVNWVGKKVTGQHSGTIQLKSGHFLMEDGKLIGGEFTIDMNTIAVTDLSGEYQTKLEGHLKSDDFFGVETFPTSKLVITSAEKTSDGYKINADLTIKEITNPIEFDLKMVENTASASFQIDRAKYNVRYGSGSFFDNLGDNMIYDNFDVEVLLKF
ncbi:MAG TPA: YceI family protein [Flavobacteriaceae bacterium]|nr:YceI family protein [Flavobacteriaceae bacterium]